MVTGTLSSALWIALGLGTAALATVQSNNDDDSRALAS